MIRLPIVARLQARRARQDRKIQQLAAHPLFEGLTPRELRLVTDCVDIVWVPKGKVLARQGSMPVETFVINRGSAQVLLDDVVVSSVDRRQTVGLLARHHDVPFGATLVAATDMELYVVAPRCLRTFVELLPDAIAEQWSDFAPRAAVPATA
jgi:CRP-like cAMP-binding protein